MSTRVTIKDIAKAYGCSVNCVSRALMDAPDISESTKEKIKQLAAEMGYVYNRNAATLRVGKSRTVGILFDSLLNPFYFIMTNYIWGRLDREGYSIVTLKNNTLSFGEDVVRQMISNNVDGLLSFLQPTEAACREIENNSLPTVVIGRKTHGMCDCIYLDDVAGGALAAKYFIERGYRKPMYLGETDSLECSLERGTGFKSEFDKIGITPRMVYGVPDRDNKFAAYFKELVDGGEAPDCVFCFSDLVAYEVMSVLDKNNLTDIEVVGYDDIQKEISLPGALKSIAYDKKAMAESAVSLLLEKINGDVKTKRRETVISDFKLDGVTSDRK
ncbi:MAG: LacI family DNA-binding transcriptional regulator [Clostridiales bacterium]|nr:LacI family DNA-binding transcriptional regulator [Clostridiales bacterium]